jgi:hypothetical protein
MLNWQFPHHNSGAADLMPPGRALNRLKRDLEVETTSDYVQLFITSLYAGLPHGDSRGASYIKQRSSEKIQELTLVAGLLIPKY